MFSLRCCFRFIFIFLLTLCSHVPCYNISLVVVFAFSFDRLLGSWYLITVTANPDKVDEAIKACQVRRNTPWFLAHGFVDCRKAAFNIRRCVFLLFLCGCRLLSYLLSLLVCGFNMLSVVALLLFYSYVFNGANVVLVPGSFMCVSVVRTWSSTCCCSFCVCVFQWYVRDIRYCSSLLQ